MEYCVARHRYAVVVVIGSPVVASLVSIPEGSQWSVLAAGASQLPITTHGLLMGAHVRVGFEDNVYLSKGVPAKSNAQFVERTCNLAKILGREVATCAEARRILGIGEKK